MAEEGAAVLPVEVGVRALQALYLAANFIFSGRGGFGGGASFGPPDQVFGMRILSRLSAQY